MIDDLKGSAIYIPVIFAVLCGVGFALCWKWMQSAIGDAIRPVQAQLDKLTLKVARLENGRAKATNLLTQGLDDLPHVDANESSRKYFREAVAVLNNASESHE